MKPEVARVLEAMVGPLMAQGMGLEVAEKIAKRRAFEAETYSGEQCDRCTTVQALLWDWGPTGDMPAEPKVRLCDECSRKEALWRQREDTRRRIQEAEARADQDSRGIK